MNCLQVLLRRALDELMKALHWHVFATLYFSQERFWPQADKRQGSKTVYFQDNNPFVEEASSVYGLPRIRRSEADDGDERKLVVVHGDGDCGGRVLTRCLCGSIGTTTGDFATSRPLLPPTRQGCSCATSTASRPRGPLTPPSRASMPAPPTAWRLGSTVGAAGCTTATTS